MYSRGAGTPPVFDAVNAFNPLPISVLAENQNYIAETTSIGECTNHQPGAAPAQTNRYFSLSLQEIRNKVRWLWTGTGAIGPCAKSPGQGVPPELLYVLHL